jgi:hypothetical protein
MIPGIQLPLFPLAKAEDSEAFRLYHQAREGRKDWTVRNTSTHGPIQLHYLDTDGVWLVSTYARVVGPSGNRAVKAHYIYEKVFLLHQLSKAITFANRASEPYLEQSYYFVLDSMVSGRRVGPYEGFPYGG